MLIEKAGTGKQEQRVSVARRGTQMFTTPAAASRITPFLQCASATPPPAAQAPVRRETPSPPNKQATALPRRMAIDVVFMRAMRLVVRSRLLQCCQACLFAATTEGCCRSNVRCRRSDERTKNVQAMLCAGTPARASRHHNRSSALQR